MFVIGFEVPIAMSTKNAFFRDVTPCGPAEVYQLFKIKYCLHLHGG
jgi:hypothetical protein